MSNRNCGVCNKQVSIYERQIGRQEKNGDITPYHMSCERQAKKIEPCEDCGEHRLFCNDCGEPPFDN